MHKDNDRMMKGTDKDTLKSKVLVISCHLILKQVVIALLWTVYFFSIHWNWHPYRFVQFFLWTICLAIRLLITWWEVSSSYQEACGNLAENYFIISLQKLHCEHLQPSDLSLHFTKQSIFDYCSCSVTAGAALWTHSLLLIFFFNY